jgi:uncharacterized RDD family membrane protein YckC
MLSCYSSLPSWCLRAWRWLGFGSGTTTSSAPLEVAIFLILETVFAIKDGFRGQSPGKFVLGVQVVDRTTLEPVGFRQSFLRNLPLYVPRAAYTTVILLTQSPFGAFLGLASLAIVLIIAIQMKNGPRLGDKFANTKVILVKRRFRPPFDTRGVVCIKCGYDLRGNVSGICPECGYRVTPQSANGPASNVAGGAAPVPPVTPPTPPLANPVGQTPPPPPPTAIPDAPPPPPLPEQDQES